MGRSKKPVVDAGAVAVAAPEDTSTAPVAAEESSVAAVGLTEAIREARADLGDDRSRDATSTIKSWIIAKYPALQTKVESPSFNSTLSGMRKKDSAGSDTESNGAPRLPRERTAPATAPVPSGPSLADLLAAKAVATELKMKPPELLELVEKLKTVGSLDTLSACLKGLEKLSG